MILIKVNQYSDIFYWLAFSAVWNSSQSSSSNEGQKHTVWHGRFEFICLLIISIIIKKYVSKKIVYYIKNG